MTITRPMVAVFALVTWAGTLGARGPAQLQERNFSGTLDHPAIQYYGPEAPDDAVIRLNRRLVSGETRLDLRTPRDTLRTLLEALDVDVDSQIVVYSRTGVQAAFTGPRTPRAFYFNDTTVVGWIQGAPLIELASLDPRQGLMFYTGPQQPEAGDGFERTFTCLSCHVSLNTLDVPGAIARSVFTSPIGTALFRYGSLIVDHRTPFAERWGGWYVTAERAPTRHRGNVLASEAQDPESLISPQTATLRTLADRIDTTAYLSPHSDLAALMVFDHQMHGMNLLTRVGWEARVAEHDGRFDVSKGLLKDAIDELTDYLLFVDEPALDTPVKGTSGFAARFSSLGPRDAKGRSLRELDLQTRLTRFPCSYLVYSPAFEALPARVKAAVYARLWTVLADAAPGARYGRFSAAERRAVIEILRDTRTDLPSTFR
jgi:hypothetical protein